eukprot:6398648-Pyramimonas_sp.AAC.1
MSCLACAWPSLAAVNLIDHCASCCGHLKACRMLSRRADSRGQPSQSRRRLAGAHCAHFLRS